MDPRQRRTRAALHEAVLALAEDTSVADLSVTALAARAGVHRSTFYEHAASPAALLEQALLVELDALQAALLADEDEVGVAVTRVTEAVLCHVAEHRAIYRRGLADDSGGADLRAMLGRHFRASSRMLRERARVRLDLAVPGVDDDVVGEAASRFLADGTVGAIAVWLEQPDLDVADFLRLYVRLAPPWWPRDLTVSG